MPCVQGCTAAATIDIEERQRGLFLAAAGACGPSGSAKYRTAPPPVVGRIAVGTGSTLGAGHPFEHEKEHERHEGTKGAKVQEFNRPEFAIQAEPAELPNPAGATLVLVGAGKYNNEIQDLSNSVNPPDWLLYSGEREEKNR